MRLNRTLKHPPIRLKSMAAMLLLLLVTALYPQRSQAAPPPQGGICQNNVLVNPGFEDGFSTVDRNEVIVANGWSPWYRRNINIPGVNYIPEYKPEDRNVSGGLRIHSGNFAQKYFTTYATHTAGILQTATVPGNSIVTFSIWVQVWTNDDDNTDASSKPGNYRVAVGIDPAGGDDSAAESVVWSDPQMIYDRWALLTVTTKAQGNRVTVFTRSTPEFPVKHNDSYWDDACLSVEQPPTSTPAPTNTRAPTNTPAPTNSPTITLTPAPPTVTSTPSTTPTETRTPVPTATPTLTQSPTSTHSPTTTPSITPLPSGTPLPTSTPLPTGTAEPVLAQWRQAVGTGQATGVLFAGLAVLLLAGMWLINRQG